MSSRPSRRRDLAFAWARVALYDAAELLALAAFVAGLLALAYAAGA